MQYIYVMLCYVVLLT